MKTMKMIFWCLAAIFAVFAVTCYIGSVKDTGLGFEVANIQLTVFAAACAVLCGINVTGAIIVMSQEKCIEEMNASEERIKKTFVGVLEEEVNSLQKPLKKSNQVPSKADLYIGKKEAN